MLDDFVNVGLATVTTPHGVWVARERTHSHVFTFWKKNFVWYLWKRFAHQWNINNNISIETITWQHNISLWISSLFFLQTPWNHGWNFYAQKCSIKYFHDYFVSFFLVAGNLDWIQLDSSPGLWTSVGMPIRLIPGMHVVLILLVRKLILPE